MDWEGCFNARDLGGLPLIGGGTTRFRAVVRSDSLQELTAAGWEAALEHGVRTVIDLRNEDEIGPDAAPRPAEVSTVRLPLDATEDREFWDVWRNGPQFGTPLYYGPHLERFPERSARVLEAIARARPGAVAFHCEGGRDRVGQITTLVLAAAGVEPGAIAEDYGLSAQRLAPRFERRGEEDQEPMLASYLAERGTTATALIEALAAQVDVERDLGLAPEDVAALRDRLAGP